MGYDQCEDYRRRIQQERTECRLPIEVRTWRELPRSSRGQARLYFPALTRGLLALSCVLLVAGCEPSVETVASTNDQAVLADIAIRDSWGGADVCLAAVQKLSDQGLLGKVAVKSVHDNVRMAAVAKLSDRRLLAKIAVEDPSSEVRRVAVERLSQTTLGRVAHERKLKLPSIEESQRTVASTSDQAVLADIAITDSWQWKGWDVCLPAVAKLSDQRLLAEVAVEAGYCQAEAVAKLSDQGLLSQVAVESRDVRASSAAVQKLSDQGLLGKIAMGHPSSEVRKAAVERLTDQATLYRVAREEKQPSIRIVAVQRITDQSILSGFASEQPAAAVRLAAVSRVSNHDFLLVRSRVDPSNAVRTAAVEAMSKETYLARVAIENDHQAQRQAAAARVTDPALLRQVNAAIQQRAVEVAAIDSQTDDGMLLQTALHGKFDVLRLAAARRLDRQAVLGKVANETKDLEVRKIIFAKLTDREVLANVAANAADNAVRIAAKVKSGQTTWREVFNKASASDSGPAALGEALAAVGLFPGQADTIQQVVQACLNFIRRGDETRIPELIDMLDRYGDKPLAEDYLNCGQPDLDAAGREWASQHGYPVRTGTGSHRAVWGSEK